MSGASPPQREEADGLLTAQVCTDVIDLFAEFDWFLDNWPKVPVMKRVGLKSRLLKVIMKHVKAAARKRATRASPSSSPAGKCAAPEAKEKQEATATEACDSARGGTEQRRQEMTGRSPTNVLAEPLPETSAACSSGEGKEASETEDASVDEATGMEGASAPAARERQCSVSEGSARPKHRSGSLVLNRSLRSWTRGQLSEGSSAVAEELADIDTPGGSASDSSTHSWAFCEPQGFSMPDYSEEESTEESVSQCSSPREDTGAEHVQWTKVSGSAAVAITRSLGPIVSRRFEGVDVLRSASHQLLRAIQKWTSKEHGFSEFHKAAITYLDAVPLAMQLRVTWDLSKWMMGGVVSMKKFLDTQNCNEKLVLEAASLRPSVITIVINDLLKEVKFKFDQISHILRDILSTMIVDVPERLWSRDSAILMNLFHTIVRVVKRLIYLVTTVHRLEELRDSMPPEEGELKLLTGFDLEAGMRPFCNGAMSIDNILFNMTAATNASDSRTIATFVVTYSTYISPTEFFSRLVDCFHQVWEREDKDTASMVRMRVGQVLKSWVKRRFGDFDQDLLQGLHSFIEDHVKPYSAAMAKILAAATEEEEAKRQARQQMVKLLEPKPYRDDEISNGHHCSLLESASVAEVAQQMTVIDTQLFEAIENQALLHAAWEKPHLAHCAQSVTQQMDRLNRITWWVGLEVLSRETPEERAEVMKWFLALAEELKSLRNYQSMTGVVAGLSQLTVHRLKVTKKALGKRATRSLAAMRSLMDPSDQHGNYRAEQRKGLGKRSVPYIGVWLSDLARIDEGNDDYVGTLVNFDKCALIYSVVSEIELAKDMLHSFPVQEPLYTQLTYLPELDEDVLYELSILREPVKRKT